MGKKGVFRKPPKNGPFWPDFDPISIEKARDLRPAVKTAI